MKPVEKEREKGASLDFTLLLKKMEQDLVKGQNQETWKRILPREDIWKRAEPEKQLEWARFAQMARDVETALKVFEHINQAAPALGQAWVGRLELLFILGRPEEMARVVAASRGHIEEKVHAAWLERCKGLGKKEVHSRLETAAAAPFETLRQRQEAIERYLRLFSGREDCFARQWVNKEEGKQGYIPMRRPMQEQDVEEHIRGRKTYGIYLIRSDGTAAVAVIDADVVKGFRNRKLTAEEKSLIARERSYLLTRINECAGEAGLKPLMEYSGGKGFHFWFFFDPPVPAATAKRCLEGIERPIARDLTAFSLEVFPKQEHLSGKGLGNLVKLPLGIHRLTGKPSFFLGCNDRTVEGQMAFLKKVTPAAAVPLQGLGAENPDEKIVPHPKWQQWARDFPELHKLQSTCTPLAQVLGVCRSGKELSLREEKVILQTIGFLPRAKTLIHHLMGGLPEYNPHLVDFKLSRVRGSPLGCKRIHSLLQYNGDLCPFEQGPDYAHPLLHLGPWDRSEGVRSEKVENLAGALDNLQAAISQVRRFLA